MAAWRGFEPLSSNIKMRHGRFVAWDGLTCAAAAINAIGYTGMRTLQVSDDPNKALCSREKLTLAKDFGCVEGLVLLVEK